MRIGGRQAFHLGVLSLHVDGVVHVLEAAGAAEAQLLPQDQPLLDDEDLLEHGDHGDPSVLLVVRHRQRLAGGEFATDRAAFDGHRFGAQRCLQPLLSDFGAEMYPDPSGLDLTSRNPSGFLDDWDYRCIYGTAVIVVLWHLLGFPYAVPRSTDTTNMASADSFTAPV